MICHCDACNYTFESSVLRTKYDVPTRCPDCGKKTVAPHVPAVRAATEDEIKTYEEDQRSVMEELYEELNGKPDEELNGELGGRKDDEVRVVPFPGRCEANRA